MDITPMTKNQKYEAKQKAKGLKKITVWIPVDAEIEFKSMSEHCCENKGQIPFMARDLSTGRMCKAI